MSFLDEVSLKDLDDIRERILQTPKPRLRADKAIQLGPCGMGMPVLKSHWALLEMAPGQVLRTESGHP